MAGSVQSFLVGCAGLAALLAAAIVLWIARPIRRASKSRLESLSNVMAWGIIFYVVHQIECFLGTFHVTLPQLFGWIAWPGSLYLAVQAGCVLIWLPSTAGIRHLNRAAFLPAWFFALVAMGLGFLVPVLALTVEGYFPGLMSSSLVGVMGALTLRQLWGLSR